MAHTEEAAPEDPEDDPPDGRGNRGRRSDRRRTLLGTPRRFGGRTGNACGHAHFLTGGEAFVRRGNRSTPSLAQHPLDAPPRWMRAALCLCLLGLLAACGGSGGGSRVEDSNHFPVPNATPPPAPTPTPQPPGSCAGLWTTATVCSNACCVPIGFEDDDPSNDPDVNDIIAALFKIDSDGDGESDGSELMRGSDPHDPTDGDADGDGIENRLDPDVDGDGIPNGEDDDIDGDGILNGDDDDMDGDGLDNADDPDDDGDGIDDDADEDDDADGEDDCECEHGVCSEFKGLCYCEAGWKGEDCDEFTCRDVGNCNHGTCIGPNACRCAVGWESQGGTPCNTYHCRGVANCNGHGACVGPNTCRCDDDWKGTPDCRQQTCVRVPSVCDDGNPCTIDECDATDGCSHEPVVCSLFETCVSGNCVPSCDNTHDCDPGQACQKGGCVDDCESDTDCRDGDPCTLDECDTNAECTNEALVCPIFEACVRGACVSECTEATAGSDCDQDESCVDGGCFGNCNSDSDCEDGQTCDADEQACLPADDEGGQGQ